MVSNNLKKRIDREFKTAHAMIRLYCKIHHQSGKILCPQCERLQDYVYERIKNCRYLPDRPACSNCKTHCFSKDMREEIRKVMRYAGPRMLWKHPVLTIRHKMGM